MNTDPPPPPQLSSWLRRWQQQKLGVYVGWYIFVIVKENDYISKYESTESWLSS
jgi:hypothetical protein